MCPPAELAPESLQPHPAVEGFTTTAELADDELGIIGQERAVEAMEFGLMARGGGYHVFVAGPVGTGRSTFVRRRLRQAAKQGATPPDYCYVFNFTLPERPRLISLPAGQGRRLQREVDELVKELRSDLRQAFESREYEARRSDIGHQFERRSEEAWATLERQAELAGFALQRAITGIATVPLTADGRPMSPDMFQRLPAAQQHAILERGRALEPALAEALRALRQLDREAKEALRDLDRQTAAFAVGAGVGHLREAYAGQPQVLSFLDALAEDVALHVDAFRSEGDAAATPRFAPPEADLWQRYRINVFVDNSQTEGAPVIVEPLAGLGDLIGRVEFKPTFGALVTDFMLVRPGVLQRANGGYLVLSLKDLLEAPGAYETLKRVLRDRSVRLDGSLWGNASPFALAALNPEPMPLDVKVVLIGPALAYQALLLYDEDFRKLFKVKVEFEPDTPATEENIARHARFVGSVCRSESTPHLTADAVRAVLVHSSRLAGDQAKLTTHFNEIADLVVSAGFLARAGGREVADQDHVRRAIRDRQRRSAAAEDRLLELTRDGTLMVDVSQQVTGQVNGLTVVNLGDYAFGRPVRITARAWVGRKGVTHIERETQMSGHVHSKGVLTIAAFLAATYAQDAPLALSASLALEQMYEEVEGDSASSAELYALLSELARLPVRQSIAVTGSVNQRGEIQPVGGVIEKVEGFYRACAAVGYEGLQGVVVPHQNARHLVLGDEVVEAVRRGRFHVWTVRTLDEGLEILTGVPAGQADAEGRYPPESVHGRVAARLQRFAEELALVDSRDGEAAEG